MPHLVGRHRMSRCMSQYHCIHFHPSTGIILACWWNLGRVVTELPIPPSATFITVCLTGIKSGGCKLSLMSIGTQQPSTTLLVVVTVTGFTLPTLGVSRTSLRSGIWIKSRVRNVMYANIDAGWATSTVLIKVGTYHHVDLQSLLKIKKRRKTELKLKFSLLIAIQENMVRHWFCRIYFILWDRCYMFICLLWISPCLEKCRNANTHRKTECTSACYDR